MRAPAFARRGLQLAVKGAAEGLDLIRRPVPGITILIYHRVGAGTGAEIDLPTAAFDAQIGELADSGRVCTLDEAVAALAGGAPLPHPAPVVVTFDDGTDDLVEQALGVLERHAVPATLYLATRFVDEQVTFPGGGRPLTWSGVAELTASGLVTLGSHTHGHALLDRLPDADIADELDRSIDLIAEHTGRAPQHFAYPKAVLGSPSAQDAVRARFTSAALAGTRANPIGTTDLHRLQRSPVQLGDGTRWFRRKARGGMRFEDDLRATVNRRRYAGRST